ncbi:M48 family metallopeptidase [Alphaproteobacteria bacterium KMM 3653]|uniref:M48 family metallopeptidase n=1 Tax=Harenicola maris TaxID=2841044 RepID=A0AAP2CTD1_9RHOB|nr:M48 family metallopeptidase [Harenicola maris]
MSEQLLTFPGRFFDGLTAGAYQVQARIDPISQTLAIGGVDGTVLANWPLDELRMIKDPGYDDGVVICLAGDHEARLNIKYGEDLAILEEHAKFLKRTDVKKGTLPKILIWLGGAAAAVALMLFVILPGLANTIATVIPPEREKKIGETVVSQMEFMLGSSDGSGFCSTAQGDEALAKMTARLTEGLDIPYDLSVRVIDHPMVNAFAAPGGHIVIVRGLLDRADTPEEVAGVLAHELGHVYNRDPLRITLRAAGSAGLISMVLGDFTGGALIVLVSEQVMQASYTRAAEANADLFAHERLAASGIPAEGLATFFDKLRIQHGDTEGVMEYISSHPNLASRAQAARDAETGAEGFEPVLNEEDWAALQAICRLDDKSEEDSDEG